MEKEQIIKALEILKDLCIRTAFCGGCPLGNENGECFFRINSNIPESWDIKKSEPIWRAVQW